MRFEPMTDNAADTQANAFRLWKRGLYDFEVVEAEDRTSKAGNDMVELQVRIYNQEGRSRVIFDYLVATEATGYKIRHFASATGMLAQYEKGELDAKQMLGKTGRCQLGIQKDKQGLYPDKNIINDYVPKVAGGESGVSSAPAADEMDDEIPF